MTPRRRERRGMVIIPAMVCLLLVTMLCGSLLKLAHLRRGVVRDEERRMQAEWLAESGASRASARLSADRGYLGESWDVAARDLGGVGEGRVTIAVEAVKDHPDRRRVRIEADFPRGDVHRARQSKQLIVELKTETPGGPS